MAFDNYFFSDSQNFWWHNPYQFSDYKFSYLDFYCIYSKQHVKERKKRIERHINWSFKNRFVRSWVFSHSLRATVLNRMWQNYGFNPPPFSHFSFLFIFPHDPSNLRMTHRWRSYAYSFWNLNICFWEPIKFLFYILFSTRSDILQGTYYKVWAKFDNFLLHNKACKNMKHLSKNKNVSMNGF